MSDEKPRSPFAVPGFPISLEEGLRRQKAGIESLKRDGMVFLENIPPEKTQQLVTALVSERPDLLAEFERLEKMGGYTYEADAKIADFAATQGIDAKLYTMTGLKMGIRMFLHNKLRENKKIIPKNKVKTLAERFKSQHRATWSRIEMLRLNGTGDRSGFFKEVEEFAREEGFDPRQYAIEDLFWEILEQVGNALLRSGSKARY